MQGEVRNFKQSVAGQLVKKSGLLQLCEVERLRARIARILLLEKGRAAFFFFRHILLDFKCVQSASLFNSERSQLESVPVTLRGRDCICGPQQQRSITAANSALPLPSDWVPDRRGLQPARSDIRKSEAQAVS